MKKRLLAMILSVVMCVSFMPMMVLGATTKYDVWVNGEQFTSNKLTIICGNGTATYNPENNEVTLKNAEITKGSVKSEKGDLNVIVEGENHFELVSSDMEGIYHGAAFDAYRNLAVYGEGSIDIYMSSDTGVGSGFRSTKGDIYICFSGNINVSTYSNCVWAVKGSILMYVEGNITFTGLGSSGTCTNGILAPEGQIEYQTPYSFSVNCYQSAINGKSNVYCSIGGDINIDSSRFGIEGYNVSLYSGGKMNIESGITCISSDTSVVITNDGGANIVQRGNYYPDISHCVSAKEDLCFRGSGAVTLSNEAGDCASIGNQLLLSGNNSVVSFTAPSGYKAIANLRSVAGENINNYEVIGSPSSNSVTYKLKSYIVTFDTCGYGTAPQSQTVLCGGCPEKPSDPTAAGWKFDGWYADKNYSKPFDFDAAIVQDTTVYAKWVPCNHEHTEIKNAKDATYFEEGYTGDKCCTDCGEIISTGDKIPTLTPELSSGDFINRCYEVALGREADEAGFDAWTDKLNNGQTCGAQVGYGFIFSPEYTSKYTSNEQYVKDLYTMFFDREPDAEGYSYWVEQLDSETTGREQVFAGFANSVEFYNLCLKYGVVSGNYVEGVLNDQQGGVNCFVARLYKVCLNRLPDQGGQAGWVQKLMSGEVTGTTCAYGFVFSPEFVGKEPSNREFVNYMYAAFFGREADEEGLNYWVEQLDNGTATREDIFAGFAGSIEFDALCKSYGIQA